MISDISVHVFSELGDNRNVIKDIETSLFVLCLDKDIPEDAFREKNNASVRAVQTLTGFDSCANAGNRWHDKTVQVKRPSDTAPIVNENSTGRIIK